MTEQRSKFYRAKYLSILGDSISTLDGYNPSGYNVFYDPQNCARANINGVGDTWWGIISEWYRCELLVNNSWSGSRVTELPNRTTLFPSGCSDERTSGLSANGIDPDVIIIYLGTNDFGYGVKIKPGKIFTKPTLEYFDFAYKTMLQKIRKNYPKAKIYCCTLCPSYMSVKPDFVFPTIYQGNDIRDFNEIIHRHAFRNHCYLIDLYQFNFPYDSIDGSHPNKDGMELLAALMIKCIGKDIL